MNLTKREYKILRTPLHMSVIFMIFTVFLYLFGPKKWITNVDFIIIYMITLLIIYFSMFYFGYLYAIKKKKPNFSFDTQKKDIKSFLKYFIIVNFVFVLLNALQYSYTANLFELINRSIDGLFHPNSAYYIKIQNMRLYGSPDSLLTYITVFLGFILFPTMVLSIYYYKSLNIVYKFIVVFTIAIEVMRWLSIGSNKGIFDIVVLLVSIYLIYQLRKSLFVKRKKKNIKITLAIIFGILVFLSFFGYVITDRVQGLYDTSLFISFPYNLVPDYLRTFVERFNSYLTQGYNGMYNAIRYIDWTPMFGIGNSRFLISVIERVSGNELFQYTYASKLAAYGLDPLATWHTAYTWFANDLGFIGVIPLMFIIGFLFGNVAFESIVEENPISITLFYLMLLGILNSSGTNYTLAYSNGFVAFWQLIVLRFIIKRVKIKL